MSFTLNLNLKFKWNSNFSDSLTLSAESLSIVSLIKLCHLKSGNEFHAKCYYSKSKIIDQIPVDYFKLNQRNNLHQFISESLINKYKNFHFQKNQLLDPTKFNLQICDSDEISTSSDILDIDLPSLIRKTDAHCNISITGLASLYRDIIKIANHLKPNLKLENLLVLYLKNFIFLLDYNAVGEIKI